MDVEFVDDDLDRLETDRERAANLAAADRCVPVRAMQDFIFRHKLVISDKEMISFSRAMKRHPGIVAGQIQRAMDRYDIFKKHQPRVRQIIIKAALTDGYGRNGSLDL